MLLQAPRRAFSAAAAAAAAPSGALPWVSRESLNPNLLRTAYAVRGEMVLRAQQHQHALAAAPSPQPPKLPSPPSPASPPASSLPSSTSSSSSSNSSSSSLPFSALTYCNIGNPQELGQQPITFFRQVSALVEYPALLESPLAPQLFPPDAIARARSYLNFTHGAGLGAYTHSMGIEGVRREVAAAITERDGGVPAHAEDIFLTDGASPAVQMVLKALIRGPADAVLVPVPQYPLYSASIALYGAWRAHMRVHAHGCARMGGRALPRPRLCARSRRAHTRARPSALPRAPLQAAPWPTCT